MAYTIENVLDTRVTGSPCDGGTAVRVVVRHHDVMREGGIKTESHTEIVGVVKLVDERLVMGDALEYFVSRHPDPDLLRNVLYMAAEGTTAPIVFQSAEDK